VAHAARRRDAGDDVGVPGYDPRAVERAYVAHRAQREARLRRARARRNGRIRFLVVMAILLALAIYLAVTVWREIQQLFGL
jgi:hypothetical protein